LKLDGPRADRLVFCEHDPSALPHHRYPSRVVLIVGEVVRVEFDLQPRLSQRDADTFSEAPVYKERARLKKQFGLRTGWLPRFPLLSGHSPLPTSQSSRPPGGARR